MHSKAVALYCLSLKKSFAVLIRSSQLLGCALLLGNEVYNAEGFRKNRILSAKDKADILRIGGTGSGW